MLNLVGQVARRDVEKPATGEVRRAEDLPEVPLTARLIASLLDGELSRAGREMPAEDDGERQMLRTRLAVRFPTNTAGANGPASSGKATWSFTTCRRVFTQICPSTSRLSLSEISPARMRSVSISCSATPY